MKKLISLIEVAMEREKLNENFWRWFGDSKVVDENHNPMICFHGTPQGGFTVFEPKAGYKGKVKQQIDIGTHFSQDKDYADDYANKVKKPKNPTVYECFLKIENPLLVNHLYYREDDETVFAAMVEFAKDLFGRNFSSRYRGDFYYTREGEKTSDMQSVMLGNRDLDSVNTARLHSTILKHGLDGILYEPYNMTGTQTFNRHPPAYVVLQPHQIKALDNDGSWDAEDPDIYS